MALAGVVVSCLIFPNSLKTTSVVSLAVALFCAITRVKTDVGLILILKFWIMASLVTMFYVLIGAFKGAPTEAAIQVLLIYIVFPIVWIFVIKVFLQEVPLDFAVKGLIAVGVLACLSVFFFYYAFLSYGPESVEFFIEVPNVDVGTEGYIAATMYVFGSLIFIVGGYVASFSLLSGRKKSVLLLSLFIFVALISGRGALLLSVLIGLLLNAFVVGVNFKQRRDTNLSRDALWFFFACALVFVALDYFDLKLEQIVDPLIEKVSSVGGAGRKEQFIALINGIGESAGLGAGHGIGVDYRVNDLYPWRYEMVWAASVFRVGFIGAVIYAAPFVLVVIVGLRRLLKGTLSGDEMFVFGGFVSAFIASNTNPYIEALVFQWMFIFPVLYFIGNGEHFLWRKGPLLQH
ncbi:MAG TPA: hypothetical protein VH933_15540 [Aestuariivirgaceae bacterium]